MKHVFVASSFVVIVAIASAQQTAPPTFTSAVETLVVDVRAVDADGHLVRDLSKSDFRIFEDGREEPVTAFDFVDIPVSRTAPFIFKGKRVDQDVASNVGAEGRLYVIALDDLHSHPLRSGTVRSLAHEFIAQDMYEGDQAVVVTTSGRSDLVQQFTTNRQRLLEIVDKFSGGFASGTRCGGRQIDCDVADDVATLRSLTALSTWLGSVPARRKSVVFVSEGFDGGLSTTFDTAASIEDAAIDEVTAGSATRAAHSSDATAIGGELAELISAATKSNVSIYSIDPHGLPGGPATTVKIAPALDGEDPLSSQSVQSRLMLQMISNATGGFALTRSNGFADAFTRVAAETSASYLLGYSPTRAEPDGKFHRISVKVSRPGVNVRARAGYMSSKYKPQADALSPIAPELRELMRSPVAVSGLSMSVTAIPYRNGLSEAAIEIAADVSGHDLRLLTEEAPARGSVEFLFAISDADGHVKASEHGTLDMHLSSPTRQTLFEHGVRVLSKLTVRPGRYLLRVAGVDDVGKTQGSVQYDLDVPDFAKGTLSMAPLALGARSQRQRLTTGSDTSWQQHFSEPPTSVRAFEADDELYVSDEVYRNDPKLDAVDIAASVQDESGTTMFADRQRLEIEKSDPATAKYRMTIPLHGFRPGRYILLLEARDTRGSKVAGSRQLVFSVV